MRFRIVVVLAVALLAAPQGASASPPLPSSIASIGDSITRAADVCCWYGDHPAQSWSTGGGIFDGITSHYERILASKPTIYGHNSNDAKSGAKMRDAAAQAQAAVAQGARYVTILMGGNDVCTSSLSTMTSRSRIGRPSWHARWRSIRCSRTSAAGTRSAASTAARPSTTGSPPAT
jgi:lysophospholipase L1-like esterase